MRTGRGFPRIALVAVLLVSAAVTAGCASPEASRTRGGGSGADIGNRPSRVKMHGGSDQFWKTPDRIGVDHVPLEPAHQAREISTGGGS